MRVMNFANRSTWADIPVCITIDFGMVNGQVIREGLKNRVAPCLAKYTREGSITSLEINAYAHGHEEQASMYGGSDRLGWPASYDNEFTAGEVTAEIDDDQPIGVSREDAEQLVEFYYDELKEAFHEQ